MVEILTTYSIPTIERSANAVRGLPSLFKFLPSLAEIRETLDRWERDEMERQERIERWKRPRLPAPRQDEFVQRKATATYSGLCELHGVTHVPPGWDAIDMHRAAHKYGADLQRHIDDVMAGRAGRDPPPSLYQKILEQTRAAMRARQAEKEEEITA